MKLINLFLLAAMLSFASNAQEKKAESSFENYAYSDAIDSYERLVNQGFSSEEIYKKLGNANYFNANYKEAAEWYGKLMESQEATVDPEYFYKYAQTLKSLQEYEESDVWMLKFKEASKNDYRSKLFLQRTDYIERIKKNSGRYAIKNSSINSTTSDFAPSLNGSQLVFSSARDSGIISKKVHEWNGMPFLNLYTTPLSAVEISNYPTPFSKKVNDKTHESSTAFSKDGKTLYFTRNNSKKGSFERDKEGVSRLKIFKATLINNEWENITELPFNSDEYSIAHPTLSPDESKLYFASDMPGTYGQSDIFVVDINADGTYGIPKNLGNKINTESRETFPYVTNENVLYFASDGHPGLGGLDIFATRINDLDNVYIVNVGEPVNSQQDDFSFILDEESHKGFFASNREGGIGSDDIYGLTENEEIDLDCNLIVEGWVKDDETGELLIGAEVTLINIKNEAIAKTVSGNGGVFSIKSTCKKGVYKLVTSKNDYVKGEKDFRIINSKDTSEIEIIVSKIINHPSIGTDLITFLNLAPIYFDLDKSEIRPDAVTTLKSVIEFINEYPDINIEIRSHTDASASNLYNRKLSERRAQATIAYIEANGVVKGKLKGFGFGETQLLNECISMKKCEDAQHQINRRSEIIVIE